MAEVERFELETVGYTLLTVPPSPGPSLLEPVRQLIQSQINQGPRLTLTLSLSPCQTVACSSLWAHEEGNTSKDPLVMVGVLTLHLETGGEDNGGTTGGGGVDWALVEALGLLVGLAHSSHEHNWHNWMQVLQLHLSQVALLAAATHFPTGSLEEETVDVGTSLGELGVLSPVLDVGHLSYEVHVIEWQVVGTGSDLHDRSQVGHWVEQSGNPHNNWSLESLGPVNKLLVALSHISEPVEECLLGGIGVLLPHSWHFIQVHLQQESFHGVGDVEGTAETSVQIVQ